MEPDFSGWATKAGLKCSDGRTIMPDAFKHQDKITVPLVWQHGHSSAENVLGHAQLENRPEGVYAYGFFNDTTQGKNAKTLVQHDDIKFLSIYANQLVEKGKQVFHGMIREVSLVLAGANPGARIEQVSLAHSDGEIEVLEEEAVIHTGLELEHEVPSAEEDDQTDEDLEHANVSSDSTLQEVYDSLTDVQKEAVNYMIGAAVEQTTGTSQHSDLSSDAAPQEVFDAFSDQQKAAVQSMIDTAVEEAGTHAAHSATNPEGTDMTNVFEQGAKKDGPTLTHDQLSTIVADAKKMGSFKDAFLAHATEYGIENIDLLFPDAKNITNSPEFIARRSEWVQSVLGGTKHSPFAKVKTMFADITADEARAKGYVKGNLKKDEVIKLLKRETNAKTVYKKQKLDRDDILDITDLDVVAWLKAEMRLMLDEEIARAILISDGRPADDEDKINEDSIRPVAYDVDMYNTSLRVPADATPAQIEQAIAEGLVNYRGSGTPTLYTTRAVMMSLLLQRDTLGRRFYSTVAELSSALGVRDVVPVDVMDEHNDLVAVCVNLQDYTVGANAGGQVSMFDDFDIDYNQFKYLIETRISGALTKYKAAVTFLRDASDVVTPTAPTFVSSTGVLTIPAQAGVIYLNHNTGAIYPSGAQTAIAPGATVEVDASPAQGYGFEHDSDTDWTFTRDA